jgi:hypothetical protein
MRHLRIVITALFFSAALVARAAEPVSVAGVYHRQGCPHVDPSRMVLMPRPEAEARGFVPAADCYTVARSTHPWKYLGESGGGSSSPLPDTRFEPDEAAQAGPIHVKSFVKRDGTRVRAHDRRTPQHH